MSTMTVEPVRRSVGVDCGVEEAFRIFTREIVAWWPLDPLSIAGDDVAEVIVEERVGGEMYEVSKDGERAHWATVTAWDPPHRLALAWRVNPEWPETEVEVRFTPFEDGNGTRVEVEHRGFESGDRRGNYDRGWERVLGCFADEVARRA